MYTLFILFLILNCWYTYSEACMCLPNHPQNSFCKADFALHVEVLSKKRYTSVADLKKFQQFGFMLPRFGTYKMRAVQIFKGEEKLHEVSNGDVTNNKIFEVQTPENNNMCGASFINKRQYLVTGRIVNGEIIVNKCDWTMEWSELTNRMREGVLGEYDCRCYVATCVDGYCDRNVGCKWQVTWDRPLDECKMKHSLCQQSILNTCKWDSNCS